jgi:hypothetical protein
VQVLEGRGGLEVVEVLDVVKVWRSCRQKGLEARSRGKR